MEQKERLLDELNTADFLHEGFEDFLSLIFEIGNSRNTNLVPDLLASKFVTLFGFDEMILVAPSFRLQQAQFWSSKPGSSFAIPNSTTNDWGYFLGYAENTEQEALVLNLSDPSTAEQIQLLFGRQIGQHSALLKHLYNNGLYSGTLIFVVKSQIVLNGRRRHLLRLISLHLSLLLSQLHLRDQLDQQNKRLADKEAQVSSLQVLSNEISGIRNTTDLIKFIRTSLSKVLPFTHSIFTLTDALRRTYSGFVFDQSLPVGIYPGNIHSLEDRLMSTVLNSPAPVVINIETIVSDPESPNWLRQSYGSGSREVAAITLSLADQDFGVLFLFADQIRTFRQEQLQTITKLSFQLANAIAGILTNTELMRQENEKALLLQLSTELATARDLEGLTNVISKRLNNLFSASEYMLTIKNDDQNIQTYFLNDEHTGSSKDFRFEHIKGKSLPVQESLARIVFASKTPVTFPVEDLMQPGHLHLESAGFLKSVGVKMIMGTPLKAVDEVIGALWTFDTFSINERLLAGVASQIAVALANTSANEKIERHLDQISNYKQQLEVENRYLQEEIQTTHNYGEIVGKGPAMSRIFMSISQVSATDSTVLILGETGTGKELIARAVHLGSPRKNKLMVKLNCAAIPPNLIESELFGHERGAFTGAVERRIGKFELADNSTLFLDEIGELTLELQVKLLRALQEREIERVGGRSTIKVNVRIIAATNRELYKEVQNGNFRSDLYFRLNVFPISLPSLRDRREDIPALASHFLLKYANKNNKGKMAFSNKAIKQLTAYNYPGNVRELEHLIERSILLNAGNIIAQVHLPLMEAGEVGQLFAEERIKTIDEIEREHIISVLRKTKGRVAGLGGAAELLKIPSTTLNSKIARLKIKKGLLP